MFFDVEGEVQSQIVVNKDRPVSQHDSRLNKGAKKGNGVIVRRKRIKSTRPGGIRGGVLIQDKYGTQTPNSSKMKFRRGQISQ